MSEVIDAIVRSVPGAPRDHSVDDWKAGHPDCPVTGIVCTSTVTMDVLQRVVESGSNLVITHEPTFYNHFDHVEWLGNDPIYLAKKQFIEDHNLGIWRFHDYWHMHQPDGIATGMLQALGWESYWTQRDTRLMTLPAMSLHDVVQHVKQKLGIPTVRIVGHPSMRVERIGLAFGAIGGEKQIDLYRDFDVDTVICGETVEWQTAEYVRDALSLGKHKSLIVLGHVNSEELGMKYCVKWLSERISGVPITFVSTGDPFHFV